MATKSDIKQGVDQRNPVLDRAVDGSWSQVPLRRTRKSFIDFIRRMFPRLLILGFALTACGGRVPHPPYTSHPTSALVEVDYPPPPARVEFVTEQPARNAVWLNGEWSWTGRRWGWKPGGWVVVPQGAAYAKLTLVRRTDGKLFFAEGTWRNAQGEEIPAPEFKASSAAKASAVVDPEGDPAPTAADLEGDAGADAGARAPARSPSREEERSQPREEERTP